MAGVHFNENPRRSKPGKTEFVYWTNERPAQGFFSVVWEDFRQTSEKSSKNKSIVIVTRPNGCHLNTHTAMCAAWLLCCQYLMNQIGWPQRQKRGEAKMCARVEKKLAQKWQLELVTVRPYRYSHSKRFRNWPRRRWKDLISFLFFYASLPLKGNSH